MNTKDKVYHEILEHVIRLLSQHRPIEMIAGCMMAIAQRLYKTHLSEEDYQAIMRAAQETEVEPYNIKEGTVH